jgi:hypothetical protein
MQAGPPAMPQEQVDFIEDTIRSCRAHGMEIILFELPIPDLLCRTAVRKKLPDCSEIPGIL